MRLSSLMIDRHAFASNASSFDTAWRTFGWTPAILDRAGSLEETVPWATAAARAERPARLSGRAEAVLDPANFDRLQFALLPLDGRLGFSVWGATERVRGAPEWRVLTHTLLFDLDAFEKLAGFPFALLRDSEHNAWFRAMVERAAFYEPAPLEPIEVPGSATSRASFERARQREVARLRELLIGSYGNGRSLERRVAVVYEALAKARVGNGNQRVALRCHGSQTEALLVRLAWISLPLAERASVFFSTEQRKMERPPATLFVLPEAEWGRFVPEATEVLEPAGDLTDRDVSTGRAYWAAALAQDAALHARLSALAERRGWRLLARDDVGRVRALQQWQLRVARGVLDFDAVRELIAIETDPANAAVRLRARGIGHVVALASSASSVNSRARADRSYELLRALPPGANVVAMRAAARTLTRGNDVDKQTAALLRIMAAAVEAHVSGEELRSALNAVSHDATRTCELVGSVIDVWQPSWLIREDILDALTAALFGATHGRHTADAARQATRLLTAILGVMNGRALSTSHVDAILRLSWLECAHSHRATSLEQHGADNPRAALPLLMQLLVSTPPLPLFLRMRRLLLALPQSHLAERPELEQWRAALQDTCPALYARMPREGRNGYPLAQPR